MSGQLTSTDYFIAEKNGIPRHTAYCRYKSLGWEKERAITEPLRKAVPKTKKFIWHQYEEISIVPRVIFYKRVKAGMSPEKAATTPMPGKQNKQFLSPEVLEEARKTASTITLYMAGFISINGQ